MAEENTVIQMKLLSVGEVRFMMSPEMVKDNTNPEAIKIGFSNRVEPNLADGQISIVFGVRYVFGEDVILESIYRFTFAVVDVNRFVAINKDGSITIMHLMPHFISVAVGTMRGILVVKTAGTSLSQYPLPMIDVNQLSENLSTSARK
jgi:hypothetical protein